MSIEIHVPLVKNGIEGKGFNNGIDINCGITVIPDLSVGGENLNEVTVGIIQNTPGNGPHVVVSIDPVGFIAPLLVAPDLVTWQLIPYVANCDGLGTPECISAGITSPGLTVRCVGTSRSKPVDGIDTRLTACESVCDLLEDVCARDKCKRDCQDCDNADLANCENLRDECYLSAELNKGTTDNETDCYGLCGCNPVCVDFCRKCMRTCALNSPDINTISRQDCEDGCNPGQNNKCFHYFTCQFAFDTQLIITNDEGDDEVLGRVGLLTEALDGSICGCQEDRCGVKRCCPCDEGWGARHDFFSTENVDGQFVVAKNEVCTELSKGCDCSPVDPQLATDTLEAGQSVTPEDIDYFVDECRCPSLIIGINPFWVLSGPGTIDKETGKYTAPNPLPSGCIEAAIQICCEDRQTGRLTCSDLKKIRLRKDSTSLAATWLSCRQSFSVGGHGCGSKAMQEVDCAGTRSAGSGVTGGSFGGCDTALPHESHSVDCKDNAAFVFGDPCCKCCDKTDPQAPCCRWTDVRTQALKDANCCPEELRTL